MSIIGKIVGGAAGFALGGPLGALLGLAAGHAADKVAEARTGPVDDATRQVAFTSAVIVLGAKLAKADGRVSRFEVDAFKQVFDIPPEDVKSVGRLFDIAKKDSRGFEPYARQMGRMFADDPAVLEQLLNALFHIAKADGVYHPNERAFLREVARLFGFDEGAFERIEARHTGRPADDPYRLLGIEPGADEAAVRAAYRRAVRAKHPDLALADGRRSVEQATREMAAVNDAYRRIRERRGWV